MGGTSSKFGRHSTAKQIVDELCGPTSLAGKVAVVTGGNSGIGLETVKALAYAGVKVILASRSIESGQNAIKEEIENLGNGDYSLDSNQTKNIIVKQLDLSSISSIKKFADDVNASEDRIDFLVCSLYDLSFQQFINRGS